MSKKEIHSVCIEIIEKRIYLIRGRKVMFDNDLAELYGVSTKRFNEQVKRNISRFPEDFMFQLSESEYLNLRSQNATSSWGGRRYLPYVFTDYGVAMLSSVLNSEKAIEVNIQIMRVFSKLREFMVSHKDLAMKIEEIEKKYDNQFKSVFEAIKRLVTYPDDAYKRSKIGFIAK